VGIVRSVVWAFAVIGLFSAAPAYAQKETAEQRTATPTKGLLWGSKMTVESEPCCTPRPGAKSVDRTEAAVLASLTDRALRDGPILKLKLQNGRILKITDCNDQDACEADRFRMHRLAAWWPTPGYYVVFVGLYEDSIAYLISERDGRTTRIAALPVLSPSRRSAVALQSNLMNGVDLNLIDMTADPPKVEEVTTFPACAGAGPDSFLRPKPVWVDDAQVRFEGVSPQPGDDPNTKQLLRIGAGGPKWEC
jgi:hypothetical protein